VRYQIVIYFMLAAGTALSTLIVVLLAFHASVQFVTQLCLDRLNKVK